MNEHPSRAMQAARIAAEVAALVERAERDPTPASGLTATKQRRAKGDIRDEDHRIENGATVRRSTARAPLSLSVLDPPKAGEPQRKALGALDTTLTHEERVALARMVAAAFVSEGRISIGNYGGATASSDPGQRMPFNAREQAALEARRYVWKRIPLTYQRDLEFLTLWIAGGGKAPIDVATWSRKYGSTADARVASGIFRGSYKRLAEMVCELLLHHDTEVARRKAEARAAEDRRQLLLGNSLDPKENLHHVAKKHVKS
jgi:hypothetical protein